MAQGREADDFPDGSFPPKSGLTLPCVFGTMRLSSASKGSGNGKIKMALLTIDGMEDAQNPSKMAEGDEMSGERETGRH